MFKGLCKKRNKRLIKNSLRSQACLNSPLKGFITSKPSNRQRRSKHKCTHKLHKICQFSMLSSGMSSGRLHTLKVTRRFTD